MRALFIATLLNAAVCLAGCAPEKTRYVSTRIDGGDGDSGAGGGDGDGDGDIEPRGNACKSFDPDKVHLWGLTFENVGNIVPPLDGFVNELDEQQICNLKDDASFPRVRPTDERIYYRQRKRNGDKVELTIVTYQLDDRGMPIVEDSIVQTEQLPTTSCAGPVALFHFHPSTGDFFYNCSFGGEMPALAGLFKTNSQVNYDGPWFDEAGVEVTMEAILAVGHDGFLVEGDGFLGLGILPDGQSSIIPVVYDGEEISESENILLAVRSHDDGFRMMIGGVDAAFSTRRLFSVDGQGVATLEGMFPNIDREDVSNRKLNPQSFNYALDPEGQLYEDQSVGIILSNIDGDQRFIYDQRDSSSGLRGGFAPYLITGP